MTRMRLFNRLNKIVVNTSQALKRYIKLYRT